MTTDPESRIEAVARELNPGSWWAESTDEVGKTFYRERAARVLAAADSVDPLRVRVDTTPEPPTFEDREAHREALSRIFAQYGEPADAVSCWDAADAILAAGWRPVGDVTTPEEQPK